MPNTLQRPRILSWRTLGIVLCAGSLGFAGALLLPFWGVSTSHAANEAAQTIQGKHIYGGAILVDLGIAGTLLMLLLRERIGYYWLGIPICVWMMILGGIDILQGIPR